jgi:hypothetical protein
VNDHRHHHDHHNHPSAIGLIPSLSSLIPDWSTLSTGLQYKRDPFALGSLIALMMEAAHTSETSVDVCFTRQYIPEDKSELHDHHQFLLLLSGGYGSTEVSTPGSVCC